MQHGEVWVLGSLLLQGSRESPELESWKGCCEMALGIPMSDQEDFALSPPGKSWICAWLQNVTAHLAAHGSGSKAFGFSAKYYEKLLLPYVIRFVMIIVTSEPITFLVFSRWFSLLWMLNASKFRQTTQMCLDLKIKIKKYLFVSAAVRVFWPHLFPVL